MRTIRYSLRQLRRNPGFAAVAIVTLALGIGATTAIFSVMDGVLLSPLPYPEPDRLTVVALYNRTLGYPTMTSYPDFLDWQRGSRSFDSMAAFKFLGFDLTSPGTAEHLDGVEVSSTFFSTLGLKLALGRAFSSEEDRAGGAPAAVISHELWRDRFGGSQAALGRSITLNGAGYQRIAATEGREHIVRGDGGGSSDVSGKHRGPGAGRSAGGVNAAASRGANRSHGRAPA